ncbi:MAG: TlpA family protein disulfide reductase [Gammaproteobacteria bacterium]|nr:TlpA family protein disulfide reductase [Gammaproteobacteria bacterium]
MRLILSLTVFLLFNIAAHAASNSTLTFKTDTGAIQLSDYKGKVIYLDFWASWCIPCRKSFPWMNDMQKRLGNKGFKVIAVNLDQEQDKAKAFLEKIPANFTVAYDPEGVSAVAFKVKGMPSSYLIDRTGKISFTHIGFREKEIPEMEQKIKQLLTK